MERCCLFSFMNVGRSAAIHGVADSRMVGQFILQVHDGLGAPDEEDGISVVQATHLVRGEQFFTTMSSDEFKESKKLPLCCERWIKYYKL